MNYADIKRVDVANGLGVRVSLFVSGCTHHCKECFNPETWDFSFGDPFGEVQIQEILKLLDRSYIRGLSLLGGEPFEPQNQQAVLELVRRVRETLPQKDVWCYSGYLFEELAEGNVGGAQPAAAGAAGHFGGRPLCAGAEGPGAAVPGFGQPAHH